MAPPIFLLAPPRSYTSLVNAMLGQHPQAFGLPELCLFNVEHLVDLWRGSDGPISENGAVARHGLMRALAEIYGGEQTVATVNMARAWAGARNDWTTGRVFQEIVAKIHPLVAVEKSPSYTMSKVRLGWLLHAFPDARFVHLLRHPIAQCKSLMAINEGAFAIKTEAIEFRDDHCVLEPQIAWYDLNLNILEFLESVPASQQIRMRGEDIIGDPEWHLAELAEWAGWSTDEEAIDEMMHPERSPFACFGPINALFGNDPNFLAGPEFRPGTPKMPRLSDPAPWRDDGKGLYPEVVKMAQWFGYE
jgi:sulfotransferase family protein